MPRQLLLGPLARLRRFIDVSALLLVAKQQSLVGHDLHELQDGAVLRRPPPVDHLIHLPHGGRPGRPKNGEDFEFRVGRSRRFK